MLLAFFQTLDEKEPTWKGETGLIGSNPGMGFRPESPDGYIESTLIWFRQGISKILMELAISMNKVIIWIFECTRLDMV